ncbi:MAG: chemotaxis response regulator protein-glutamate methylesterase [Chitinispirillaceae bacterium]|nr:chemotaxis response regulator protein-glutamate methylesterase [Chitinispirillaceae bacterium]
MSQIRIFVVDDSVVYRTILLKIINSITGVRTVGVADNGKEALELIPKVKPDLITLDLNMPVMDGLESLRQLSQVYPQHKVIMISGYTREGATATLEALRAGALDFITKPDTGDEVLNGILMKEKLTNIITKCSDLLLNAETEIQSVMKNRTDTKSIPGALDVKLSLSVQPHVIAIGISTGGPKALEELLLQLPANFPLPVLIVQHMPRLFTKSLAEALERKAHVKVVEAQDEDILRAATVYIAPGGYQMRIRHASSGVVKIQITDAPAENHCKPSADYLFRSVAKVYGGNAVGVIMTGMGSDGVLGLKLMKRRGAMIIAQNRQTCTVWGMPRMAVEAGIVDNVLPLHEIATELIRLAGLPTHSLYIAT